MSKLGLLTVVLTLLWSGCGRAPRPAAGPDRDGESASATATAPVAPRPPPADAGPVESAPAEPPPRLAWVSPARCLSPCAYDPGESLVRVTRGGTPDPSGEHRVDASVVEPLRALIAAARAAGFRIRVNSAYRSYEDQARVFRRVKQAGRAARPGHSEHQLGTALDLDLPTRKAIDWLAEHAADHGFVLSYPAGKQRITGYRPEPWHVRFVGNELAAELRQNDWTVEELLRQRPGLAVAGRCDDCPTSESRAACGALTSAGTCAGTVLRWCYDGALAEVDCAASRQRCASDPEGGDADCVD